MTRIEFFVRCSIRSPVFSDSAGTSQASLPQDCLNVRGHVRAYGVRGGTNRHLTEIRRPHKLDPPTYQGLAPDSPPRSLGSTSDIPQDLST